MVYHDLADVYLTLNDRAQATHCLREAIRLGELVGNKVEIAYAIAGLKSIDFPAKRVRHYLA